MSDTRIFAKELICMNMKSKTKGEAIRELSTILFNDGRVSDKDKLITRIEDREKDITTGIGFNLAIPHTKGDFVLKPSILFAKSSDGVDFESLDEQPVNLFFMIVVPENSDDLHLRILAKISRALLKDNFKEKLIASTSKDEIFEMLDTLSE